jgi:hypothetical protein
MSCEPKDFMYPMTADIYYPIVEQGAYGDIQRQWMRDRSVACFFNYAGVEYGEDIKPEVLITEELILLGRIKEDIRISANGEQYPAINVLISNITDRNCNEVYIETSGSRKGDSTLFEIASSEPLIGPFGSIEYYKVVLRRSENQAVTI